MSSQKPYLFDDRDAEPMSLAERVGLAARYIQAAVESNTPVSRESVLEACGITPNQWNSYVKGMVEGELGRPVAYEQTRTQGERLIR